MRYFLVACLGWLAACGGGPALRNVPQPNPAVVAGAAAAIAGAATLANPQGAAQNAAEKNKPSGEKRPMKSGPSVPADVLDRLDQQGEVAAGQGSGQGSATAPGAQPQPLPPLPPGLPGAAP
jgi:hypothetical protein